MANSFKRLRKASISASLSTMQNYTCNTATQVVVIGVSACNTANSAVTFDLATYNTTAVYVVKNAPIPVGGSLILTEDQKIVLQPGDSLKTKASANSSIDVIVDLLEIT